MRRSLLTAVVAVALAGALFAQDATTTRPAATGDLAIDGKFAKTFAAADLAAMPHVDVKVKSHDGKDATYSGVPVRALLLAAGAPIAADQMRGPNVQLVVVASAADGYRVAFALAEFDATYAERGILLADRRDGKPLDAKEGPLRLIVPQEAKQGRWIRQLVKLTIADAPR